MKQAKTFILAGLATLILATSAWAGPVQLKELPAEARWVLHIDAQEVLKSSLGDIIRDIAADPEVAPKLAALEAIFSFNILRDVHGVTLGGSSTEEDNAAIYIYGSFDREKLETIVKAGDNYNGIPHGAYTIHSWTEKKKNGLKRTYGCFGRDDLVIISPNEDAVKTALDTLSGKKSSLAAAMTDMQIKGDGFIFVAAARGLNEMKGIHPKAAIAKKIRDASASLNESEDKFQGSLNVRTQDVETAEQLLQMVQGIKALGLLGAEERPDLAKIAQTVETESNGATVSVSLSCPTETVVAFLRKHIEEEMKKNKEAEEKKEEPKKQTF